MRKIVGSRWYMVDSFAVRRMVNIRWVKNVNNLRKISSIICVRISTNRLIINNRYIIRCVKVQFIKLSLQVYSTILYTCLGNKINLLNNSFTYYPQCLLMRLLI